MTKAILLIMLIVLILIQFIQIDKSSPVINDNDDFLTTVPSSNQAGVIVKESCYDCHSHATTYPWYSNVAPFSWLLQNHVNEGREHLNFSIWGKYSSIEKNEMIEEIVEVIEQGEMPLKSYTLLHSNAKLDYNEKAILVDWFKSQEATIKDVSAE